MNKTIRRIAPVAILGGLVAAAVVLMRNPPEPGRRPPTQAPLITVETQTITPEDYQVILDSYGSVQPSISSELVAQVGGQVTWVSPSLRDGGYFSAGEVLLRVDQRDYEADLKIAEAQLIDARRALVEAQAQAEQAREDWQSLGRSDEPSDLVLKIPQLLAAEAQLKSAESTMQKARLAFERTEVRAPFDGRVLAQQVDLGQVVAPNTAIARVYATDAVEIRLPLRNSDLAFIDLPERYRDAAGDEARRGDVVFVSTLGDRAEWIGDLVRTESAIDDAARQLHVVGRIEDPFAADARQARPLKIGEYVSARLAGVVLPDAIVIPNESIYQGSYVYRVDEGLLQRTDIEILWQNDDEAVIGDGLAAGDQLVLTPLGQVTSGMRVAIEGEQRPRERRATPPAGETISGGPGGSGSGPGSRDRGTSDVRTDGRAAAQR